MPYYLRYQLEFKNVMDDTCSLDIFENYVGDPVDSSYLDGTTSPVIMRGIDNDRSLFTAIRGHELVAEFVSATVGIDTFISDDDLKWKGIFTVNGETIFTGFLVQEDSQEDYVEYLHRIRLKFTDGLGLLKGINLSDIDDLPWYSTPTIYEIIRACLDKTGQTLHINIRCKLFPADNSDFVTYSGLTRSRVHTRSWMVNERDFTDCYKVLSDIMTAYGATLYQYRGEWVIDRVGDRLEDGTAYFQYNTSDSATYIGVDFDIAAIGETELIKEVENPLLLSYSRASREARVTYRFNPWKELIRNLDLDEGDDVLILSDSTQTTYNLDHWTLVNRTAYSRRVLDALGDEKERYLYIAGAADNTDLTDYVQSGTFPAAQGDKLSFSFSACSETDLSGTGAIVYLKCGSNYLDDDGTWSTGASFLRLDWAAAEDSTKWKTYSIDSEPIPADGDVEIRMLLMQGCGVGNETRYKDIKIDYTTVVSGSERVTGDYNLITNAVTNKNPQGTEVFISDSLRKTNNGALLKLSGALESGWQRGATLEEYRFSQLNALSYYQAHYRSKMIFEGTFMGVFYEVQVGDIFVERPVGLWPNYTIADAAGKLFAITDLSEIDWYRCTWRATLVEIHDSTLDADISDMPSSFEYNFIFG